jgi:hypothetical protein
MNRFVSCAFAGVGAALLALMGGAGVAAPVPRDAGKGDPTPDLKVFFEAVTRAVKDEKWPAEADEKTLKGTPRVVRQRALKAADREERGLPVDFEKLTKANVDKEFKAPVLKEKFVIAETVEVTSARDSVIFASGDVKLGRALNCVIVARNVRITIADNCTILAGEYIEIASARTRMGSPPSVLVAGQWIRGTLMEGTVCHVFRPGVLPAPDEAKLAGNRPQPAIRTIRADGVVFLNAQDQTSANGPKNCTYLPQKDPIAK